MKIFGDAEGIARRMLGDKLKELLPRLPEDVAYKCGEELWAEIATQLTVTNDGRFKLRQRRKHRPSRCEECGVHMLTHKQQQEAKEVRRKTGEDPYPGAARYGGLGLCMNDYRVIMNENQRRRYNERTGK